MTEEQTMLWDTADRYLRDHTDFNQRRDQIAEAIYNQPETVSYTHLTLPTTPYV